MVHAIVFFRLDDTIYAVDIFKKQSRKTPPRIIKRAIKIYQMMANQKP